MRAGKLRHKIEIQEDRGTTRDAANRPTPSWVTINNGERWASVTPMSGRELWNARQVQPDVTHEVRTRYLAGVTPDMRVKFGTRYLGILSVINVDERNAELILACKESIA